VQEAQYIAKAEAKRQKWEYSDDKKIVMELWAFWPNNRRRDMSNMHKLLPDALEGILYKDDRWILIRDMDFCVDKQNPRVEIILREM
jgi:crossover junction endodeoxyribonuclease RusA